MLERLLTCRPILPHGREELLEQIPSALARPAYVEELEQQQKAQALVDAKVAQAKALPGDVKASVEATVSETVANVQAAPKNAVAKAKDAVAKVQSSAQAQLDAARKEIDAKKR